LLYDINILKYPVVIKEKDMLLIHFRAFNDKTIRACGVTKRSLQTTTLLFSMKWDEGCGLHSFTPEPGMP
jgi:hypothetical protein